MSSGRHQRQPRATARPRDKVQVAEAIMQRVLARSAIPGSWPQTQRVPATLAGRALPFILSLISGSTDIIGFLGLNGLFTAHVTGNIVIIAAHIIAGERTTLSAILAVP